MGLGERKKRILKAIIDEYIEHAEPVGSKSIVRRARLDLSSATIRNEMADLEQLGLLEQPHVSAGRIPSNAGYRMYVNELMNRYQLSIKEVDSINAALRMRMREMEKLINDAGRVFSELTNYTAYALAPSGSNSSIRKFELLFVDAHTTIILLLTSASLVKNKYCKSPVELTQQALSDLNRLLNETLAGLTLDRITLALVRKIETRAGEFTPLVGAVIEFVTDVLEEDSSDEVFVGGASRMLSHPEYRDPQKAARVLEYLSNNHEIKAAIKGDNTPGLVKIRIGDENTAESLREASMVYGTYGIGDKLHGIIGVVGPTRMDYAKIAANLNYFIEGLNRLLRESFPEE